MPSPLPQRKRIAQLEVENWNLKHPVGTPVTVRKDSGELIETKTRYPAELSASGHAVGWLEGISGYYLLDRATVKEPQ
jgi:hypothetical protein